MGSLLAHEATINRSYGKVEEKAFQIKGEFSKGKLENLAGKNHGKEATMVGVAAIKEEEVIW